MGEDAAALKDMAAQLAAMLRVQVEKEKKESNSRKVWGKIRRKLAEVAAIASHDPTTAGQTAGQALLKVITDASPPQAFLRSFEERLSKASPYLLKDLVLLVADELNMTPLCDSEPVHILDEEWKFCDENVDHIINCSAELSAPNAPYSVVSIVGFQSSGKSYLLNCLFGTKFPVMEARRGRHKCTRGIMLSRCTRPSLLLLDVEGYDGRKEDQDISFEKQEAILFALTVSDIMMVNMPVFLIGREQGYDTMPFRVIFKERTKLHSAGLTKILVVLRFYYGETPLEVLRAEVLDKLQQIWESVNGEHVKLTDYIEVNIVALPEDKRSEEFSDEVTALRKLLSNNTSARVPASSFSLSSRILWDSIKQNKEIDIPSHQAAIARLYCGQLVKDNLDFFDSQKHLKAGESLGRFKERLHELQRKIKTEYDEKTKMYHPDVRDKERRHMEEKLRMFYQDGPGESSIPSKSSITYMPSLGIAEASRSTPTNNYLSATEPRAMTLQEVHRATCSFSEERLLGIGGCGKVYKGVLDNGEVIVIKKLNSDPRLSEESFMSELLNLAMVRHKNIIRLVGYCSESRDKIVEYKGKLVLASEQERLLCLEYMEGGTLEELISDESCGLDWEARYKIIKGICDGLKHLHTGSEDPIYHLDLKPANILLDEDGIPKIGDFGLSRLLYSARTFVTKTFSGTPGYMPPEYINGREVSPKFDVFSLGVIVIQVIAGREGYYKSADMSSQEFIDLVTENWRKRVQPKPMLFSELVKVQKCIKIGLRCVEANRVNRPTITEIVEELNMIDFHLAALSC